MTLVNVYAQVIYCNCKISQHIQQTIEIELEIDKNYYSLLNSKYNRNFNSWEELRLATSYKIDTWFISSNFIDGYLFKNSFINELSYSENIEYPSEQHLTTIDEQYLTIYLSVDFLEKIDIKHSKFKQLLRMKKLQKILL